MSNSQLDIHVDKSEIEIEALEVKLQESAPFRKSIVSLALIWFLIALIDDLFFFISATPTGNGWRANLAENDFFRNGIRFVECRGSTVQLRWKGIQEETI